MQKLPNIWVDDDEFTRARRAKVVEHLRRWVEEYIKEFPPPEVKDVPVPDIGIGDPDDE